MSTETAPTKHEIVFAGPMPSQSNNTASIPSQPAAGHIADGAMPATSTQVDAMATDATSGAASQLPALDATIMAACFVSASTMTDCTDVPNAIWPGFLNSDISIKSTEECWCHFCSKWLANRSNLRRHVRSRHSTLRPYVCCCCSQGFSDSSNCKKHQATCTRRVRGSVSESQAPTVERVTQHTRRRDCK